MGMQKAQPFQAAGPGPEIVQGRDGQRLVAAQDDCLNAALAVDQQADLTIQLKGDLGQCMGQLGGYDLGRIQLPTVKGLQLFYLEGFKAGDISEEPVNRDTS
jgi:hypothetical protein